MSINNRLPNIGREAKDVRDNDFIAITALKDIDAAVDIAMDKVQTMSESTSSIVSISNKSEVNTVEDQLQIILFNLADAITTNGDLLKSTTITDSTTGEINGPLKGENSIPSGIDAKLNELYIKFTALAGSDEKNSTWKIPLETYFAKVYNAFEDMIKSVFAKSVNAVALESKLVDGKNYNNLPAVDLNTNEMLALNPDYSAYPRTINVLLREAHQDTIICEFDELVENNMVLNLKMFNGANYFDYNIIIDNGVCHIIRNVTVKLSVETFEIKIFKYLNDSGKTIYVLTLNNNNINSNVEYGFELSGMLIGSYNFKTTGFKVQDHASFYNYKKVDTTKLLEPVYNEIYYTIETGKVAEDLEDKSYFAREKLLTFEPTTDYYYRESRFIDIETIVIDSEIDEGTFDLDNRNIKGEKFIKTDIPVVVENKKYNDVLSMTNIDIEPSEIFGTDTRSTETVLKNKEFFRKDQGVRFFNKDGGKIYSTNDQPHLVDGKLAIGLGSKAALLQTLQPGAFKHFPYFGTTNFTNETENLKTITLEEIDMTSDDGFGIVSLLKNAESSIDGMFPVDMINYILSVRPNIVSVKTITLNGIKYIFIQDDGDEIINEHEGVLSVSFIFYFDEVNKMWLSATNTKSLKYGNQMIKVGDDYFISTSSVISKSFSDEHAELVDYMILKLNNSSKMWEYVEVVDNSKDNKLNFINKISNIEMKIYNESLLEFLFYFDGATREDDAYIVFKNISNKTIVVPEMVGTQEEYDDGTLLTRDVISADIISIANDKRMTLAVTNDGKMYFSYNGKQFKEVKARYLSEKGINPKQIYNDQNGHWLIVANDNYDLYKSTNGFDFFKIELDETVSYEINKLAIDSERDIVWVLTNGGPLHAMISCEEFYKTTITDNWKDIAWNTDCDLVIGESKCYRIGHGLTLSTALSLITSTHNISGANSIINDLNSVVNHFIIAGTNGLEVFDGITWSVKYDNVSFSGLYMGQSCFAILSDGTGYYKTSDYTVWDELTLAGITSIKHFTTYDNVNITLALTTSGIYYLDGDNFILTNMNIGEWVNVIKVVDDSTYGTVLVAVGNNGEISYSNDGKSWEHATAFQKTQILQLMDGDTENLFGLTTNQNLIYSHLDGVFTENPLTGQEFTGEMVSTSQGFFIPTTKSLIQRNLQGMNITHEIICDNIFENSDGIFALKEAGLYRFNGTDFNDYLEYNELSYLAVDGMVEISKGIFIWGIETKESVTTTVIYYKKPEDIVYTKLLSLPEGSIIECLQAVHDDLVVSIFNSETNALVYKYDIDTNEFKSKNVSDNDYRYIFNNVVEYHGELFINNGSGISGLDITTATGRIGLAKLVIDDDGFYNIKYGDNTPFDNSEENIKNFWDCEMWVFNDTLYANYKINGINKIYHYYSNDTNWDFVEIQDETDPILTMINTFCDNDITIQKSIDRSVNLKNAYDYTDEDTNYTIDHVYFDKSDSDLLATDNRNENGILKLSSEHVAIGKTVNSNKLNIVIAFNNGKLGIYDKSKDFINVVDFKYLKGVLNGLNTYRFLSEDADLDIVKVIIGSEDYDNNVYLIMNNRWHSLTTNYNGDANEVIEDTASYRIYKFSINKLFDDGNDILTELEDISGATDITDIEEYISNNEKMIISKDTVIDTYNNRTLLTHGRGYKYDNIESVLFFNIKNCCIDVISNLSWDVDCLDVEMDISRKYKTPIRYVAQFDEWKRGKYYETRDRDELSYVVLDKTNFDLGMVMKNNLDKESDFISILDKSISQDHIFVDNKVIYAYYSISGNIFAQTENGLYVSKDSCLSWNKERFLTTDDKAELIWDDNGVICVKTEKTVYYSDDEGVNWYTKNLYNYHNIVKLDDGTYLASTDNGIFKSTDSIRWIQNKDLISKAVTTVAKLSENKCLAGTAAYGVYYSNDNGSTWIQGKLDSTISGCINSITEFMDNIYLIGTDNGVYYSSDCIVWASSNLTGRLVSSIVETKSGICLAGTSNGVYYSSDGISWIQSELTGKIVNCIIESVKNKYIVGTTDNGVYYSTDGINWLQSNLTDKTVNNIVQLHNEIILISTVDGVYKSSDDGISWLSNGSVGKSVIGIVETSIGNYLCNINNNMYKSDNSKDWSIIDFYVNAETIVSQRTRNPVGLYYFDNVNYKQYYFNNDLSNDKILIVRDEVNLISDDNGKTLTEDNLYHEFTIIYKLSTGRYLAGTKGNGIYYSEDGLSWSRSDLTNKTVNVFHENNNSKCVIGTEDGVYYSNDHGATWEHSDLIGKNVNSIIEIKNDTFLTCTDLDGVFYSSDCAIWKRGTSIVGKTFNVVIKTNGGTYLAGSIDSGIFYSYDGITWIQSKLNDKTITKIIISNNVGGKYLACVNNSSIYYSYDGITWTLSGLTGKTINSLMEFSFNMYFVGTTTGIYYSTDGEVWHATDLINKNIVSLIETSNGKLMAVSDGVYYSDSSSYGVNWVRGMSTTGKSFNSVIKTASGMYLAASNANGMFYSYDSKNWIQSKKTTGTINVVFETSSHVYVAGTDSDGLYYSTDGITWTHANSNSQTFIDIMKISNGKYLAISSTNGVYYSTDGKTWAEGSTTIRGKNVTTVVETSDGKLMAGTTVGIYYSTDGVNWTTGVTIAGETINTIIKTASGIYLAGSKNSGIFYSYDAEIWMQSKLNNKNVTIIYENLQNVYLAAVNNDGIYHSTDGITWTKAATSNGLFTTVITRYYNRVFIGTTTGIYYSNDNGSSWSLCSIGNMVVNNIIEVKTNTFLAGTSKGMYRSTDGLNWTASVTMTINRKSFNSVIKTASGMYLAGSDDYGMFYSYDGEHWIQSKKTTGTINVVFETSGHVYVIGTTGDSLYYSTDGITWTHVNPTGQTFIDIMKISNGLYLAISSTNGVYNSTDGITWTPNTTFLQGKNVTSVIETSDGKLMACLYSGGTYYSTDGLNWTARTINRKSFNSVIKTASGMYLAGSNVNGIFYSYDAEIWMQSKLTTGIVSDIKQFSTSILIAIVSNSMYSSSDGITWTQSNFAYPVKVIAPDILVASNGKAFIATNAGVYYTTNGLSWTNTGGYDSVTTPVIEYKTGNFVFAKTAGGLYSSTTGTSWSAMLSDDAFDASLLTHIAYNSNSKMFVASYNRKIWYSYDMYYWAKSDHSVNSDITDLCMGKDNGFIGNNVSGVIYSTNGINWKISSMGHSSGPLCYLSNTCVLKSSSSGLLYTHDGGVTWHISNIKTLQFGPIARISNTSAVALVYDSSTSKIGFKIYYTSDSGVTWTLKFTSNWGTTRAYDIAYSNGNYLIKTSAMSGLVYSTNMTSWDFNITGLDQGSINKMYSDGNGYLFACVDGVDSSLYYSKDNGITWALCNGANLGWAVKDVVFTTGHNGFCINKYAIAKTSDLYTWTAITSDLLAKKINKVANFDNSNSFLVESDSTYEFNKYFLHDSLYWAKTDLFTSSDINGDLSKTKTIRMGNNNRYLVGSQLKGLYYSDNGYTWTLSELTSYKIYCFMYLSTFSKVLVGTDNGIYYSTNGISWTSTNLKYSVNDITYSNGVYLAGTGSHGIYYSTDGISWTSAKDLTSFINKVFKYDDGKCLSVLADYTSYLSDDNGIIWKKNDLDLSNTIYCMIKLDSGRLVIGTRGTYYSDDNGITWIKSSSTIYSVLTIVKGTNGRYFAGNQDDGVYYSDDNCKTWHNAGLSHKHVNNIIEISSNKYAIAAGFGSVYSKEGGLYYSNDNGSNWALCSDLTSIIIDIIKLNTSTSLLKLSDNNVFYSDDNGIPRNIISSLANRSFNCLILASNGKYLLGTDVGIYYSTDGKTWTLSGLTGNVVYKIVEVSSSKFLAAITAGIAYSTNGVNWVLSGLTKLPYDILKDSSTNILAATVNGVYRSVDSTNWNIGTDLTRFINKVFKYDNHKCLVNSFDYRTFISEDDGIIWKLNDLPVNTINCMIKLDSGRLVIGTAGTYYSDDNGLTWTKSSKIYNVITIMKASNNRYFALNSDDCLYTSDDECVTWTQHGVIGRNVSSIVEISTGKYLAASGYSAYYSKEGGLYYSNDNGSNWALCSDLTSIITDIIKLNDSKCLVKTNENNAYYSEDNGIIWNLISSLANRSFNSLIYTSNGKYLLGTDNGVYYSIDCKTWTSGNLTSKKINKLMEVNSTKFLAVVDEFGIYYSTNGTSWTQSNLTINVNSIEKTSSGICLAGTDNDAIHQSVDGITWSLCTDLIMKSNKVLKLDDEKGLMATEDRGTFYTDDYGISWKKTNFDLTRRFYNSIKTTEGKYLIGTNNGILDAVDGITWGNGNLTGKTINTFIKGTNGKYLVGMDSYGIYYSTDGVNYIPSNVIDKTVNYIMETEDGKYLAGTTTGVYYSYNAITWTLSDLHNGVNIITESVDNKYIATTINNGLFYSYDGIIWASINSAFKDYYIDTNNLIRQYTDNSLFYINLLNGTETFITFDPMDQINYVKVFDDIIIMNLDNENVYYSTDKGFTWTIIDNTSVTIETMFKNVYTEDDETIIVCENGVYLSNDKINWYKKALSNLEIKTLKDCGDGTLLINSLYEVYTSKNKGFTWERIFTSKNSTISCVIKTPENEYLIGTNGDGTYYSNDGINWNHNVDEDGTDLISMRINVVIKTENNNYLVGTDNHGIYYSTDGKIWIQSNLTDKIINNIIKLDTGDYVASSVNNGVYYSEDNGITWVHSNLTGKTVNVIMLSTDGKCIAGTTSNGIYYSDNGKLWTQSELINKTINTIIETTDNGYLAGTLGNGVYYSKNCVSWTQKGLNDKTINSIIKLDANKYLASTDNGLYYSTETYGTVWLEVFNAYEKIKNMISFEDDNRNLILTSDGSLYDYQIDFSYLRNYVEFDQIRHYKDITNDKYIKNDDKLFKLTNEAIDPNIDYNIDVYWDKSETMKMDVFKNLNHNFYNDLKITSLGMWRWYNSNKQAYKPVISKTDARVNDSGWLYFTPTDSNNVYTIDIGIGGYVCKVFDNNIGSFISYYDGTEYKLVKVNVKPNNSDINISITDEQFFKPQECYNCEVIDSIKTDSDNFIIINKLDTETSYGSVLQYGTNDFAYISGTETIKGLVRGFSTSIGVYFLSNELGEYVYKYNDETKKLDKTVVLSISKWIDNSLVDTIENSDMGVIVTGRESLTSVVAYNFTTGKKLSFGDVGDIGLLRPFSFRDSKDGELNNLHYIAELLVERGLPIDTYMRAVGSIMLNGEQVPIKGLKILSESGNSKKTSTVTFSIDPDARFSKNQLTLDALKTDKNTIGNISEYNRNVSGSMVNPIITKMNFTVITD